MQFLEFLSGFAQCLERRIERAQQQKHDAYLAQAVDHGDLEIRQRHVERAPAWIPFYG